jgi:hypothetical protein
LQEVPLNEAFSLGWQERVSLSGRPLQISWLKAADDSRCPEGSRCIWAGEVRVGLSLWQAEQEMSLALVLPEDPENPSVYGNYHFELLEVRPYPGSTDKRRELVLRIREITP